jgi:hypothetical protein
MGAANSPQKDSRQEELCSFAEVRKGRLCVNGPLFLSRIHVAGISWPCLIHRDNSKSPLNSQIRPMEACHHGFHGWMIDLFVSDLHADLP